MDRNRHFLKITISAFVYIDKLLWIAIHQREPGTLNLNHEPMAFLERVGYIGQFKFYALHFVGCKGLWLFKTVSESSAHDLTANQHLVSAHRIINFFGIR